MGVKIKSFKVDLLKQFGLEGFPWLAASLAYLVSFVWLLVVRGSLWADDWYLLLSSADSYNSADLRRQFGQVPWFIIYDTLFEFAGPGLFRLATLTLFFASAVCFFGITRSLNIFSPYELKILTLLFLLLPFNSSRVAVMVFHYTSAYFYFFFAWYLLISFKLSKAKVFCALLFFASFQMHSLLLFFIFPYSHLLLISRVNGTNDLVKWLKEIGWLALCPIAFWVLRTRFWPPTENYHVVTFVTLRRSSLLLLVLVVLCILILKVRKQLLLNTRKYLLVTILGLICMTVGLIPYVISGNMSSGGGIISDYWVNFLGRENWDGRHLTLQPIGFALFVFGSISAMARRLPRIRTIAFNAILTVSIIFNFCFGLEYVIDNAKQQQVIAALTVAGQINDQQDYIFIDRSINLNARGRAYRDRDWLGLIGSAYSFKFADGVTVERSCQTRSSTRLVLIDGPETHWSVIKNWLKSSHAGFVVTIFDKPEVCKPEMVQGPPIEETPPFFFYF